MALDYHTVLGTNLFTFLLGPEEVPIHVHEGPVENLSQPFHAMMTNGMKESIKRKAKIEDVDSRTFALFAEYAYTGAYRLPLNGENPGDLAGELYASQAKKVEKYCRGCGGNIGTCTSTSCSILPGVRFSAEYAVFCTYCATRILGKEVNCANCANSSQTSSFFKPQKEGRSFVERKYSTKDMQHEESRNFLKCLKPPDEPSNDLTAHARLWVFADRYLAEPLKDLCLHKLHRDLTCFKLTAATAAELFGLLEFINKNKDTNIVTTGNNTESNVGKELRDLVIAYAAVQAEKLVEYDIFKKMLAEGGDLFAEFTCMIAKRLKD